MSVAKSSASDPDRRDSAGGAPASFEQAMTELEGLVQSIEGGALPLEQSLAAYRRGAELVAYCRKALADVQQQVKILEGDLLKSFDPQEDEAP